MTDSPILVWFQKDLRLADNPALRHASLSGQPIFPVYIWSPETEGEWQLGGASRVWLEQSLASLQKELCHHRSNLIIRAGSPLEVLQALCDDTGSRQVYLNVRYEPEPRKYLRQIQEQLGKRGIEISVFEANLLLPPDRLQTRNGKVYQVFTPFWKAVVGESHQLTPPLPKPNRLPPPSGWPQSLSIDELQLTSGKAWEKRIQKACHAGEQQVTIKG